MVFTDFYLSILKSWQGDECQNALEAKVGKQNLKALHIAYRVNPEVFDNEPTELLSDVDRDKDNMISVYSSLCSFSHLNILVY
jgi:hypothetical protein